MSSLMNVIGPLKSLEERLEQQQFLEECVETSFYPKDDQQNFVTQKRDVSQKLESCLSSLNIEEFHKRCMGWIQTEADFPELEGLCIGVVSTLRISIQHTRYIQIWASAPYSSPKDQEVGTHFALQALRSIISALERFQVVSGNEELAEELNHKMVIRYLKKVISLTVVIGQLFGFDSWYGILEECMGKNLDTFIFDSEDDYRKRADTSLRSVIGDHRAVPRSFLPVEPQPPIVYQNFHHYGPFVLRNFPD